MEWLILGCAILVLIFASAVLFGAPFLPTMRTQITTAIDLLDMTAGQTLLELGSGDGRVLLEAAKRGIYGIGYEINPLLVLYSRLRTFKYRKLIRIYFKNYWHATLPAADAVYVFLLKPYMQKLDDKLTMEYSRPIKVVSFAFAFSNRQPIKEKNGVMLYTFSGSAKGNGGST